METLQFLATVVDGGGLRDQPAPGDELLARQRYDQRRSDRENVGNRLP